MIRTFAVLALLANTARAEPIVLGEGELDAQVVVEANLAAASFARPLALAPDVWYGVTPELTVGVIHSDPAFDRYSPIDASFCIHGDDTDCNHTYQGGGLDARYLALPWLAPRARLFDLEDGLFDTWKPALALGALARWQHGRFAITGDPFVQIGLANRDRGNRTQLFLPVAFEVAIDRVAIELHTGYNAPLFVATDDYHIPVYAGARVAAGAGITLGAGVGFYDLLGSQLTPKFRTLFVTIELTQKLR